VAGLVPAYRISIGLGFWEGTRPSPTAVNVDSVVAGLVPAYRISIGLGSGEGTRPSPTTSNVDSVVAGLVPAFCNRKETFCNQKETPGNRVATDFSAIAHYTRLKYWHLSTGIGAWGKHGEDPARLSRLGDDR